jgi:hypothetical protein
VLDWIEARGGQSGMTNIIHQSREPGYDAVWPLSRKAVDRASAAPRVRDLNGKTICELWDVIFRGETIYPLVRDYIKSRFPNVKFIDYSMFGNFYGPHEREVVAGLSENLRSRGCDAVIVGIGA